jgi:hypothetical protein
MQHNNCEGEDCLRFINPTLPIVIDAHAIPRRPAEEADMVPTAHQNDDVDEIARQLFL